MSGCCNKTKLIIPDPTINLQRVVDNGYKLQDVLPTPGQSMGFNGSNVVWGDFGTNTPNLQQVLDEGHIAKDVPIQLDGPSTGDAFAVMEHDKIKLDNTSNYTNEMTAVEQRIVRTVLSSPFQTNVSTAQSHTLTNNNPLNYGSNDMTAYEQTFQNAAGDTNFSNATRTRLKQGNNENTSEATKIFFSDGLNNFNQINVTSITITDSPNNTNTSTASSNTLAAGFSTNISSATTQTFTISGGITNELTASAQTLKNAANDTNVSNATSITITDNSSNHISTYKYNEVKITGASTFTATPTDITIVNGTKTIGISTSDYGIKIGGIKVCPEYAYFLNNTFSIPDLQTQTPHKITCWNKGLTPSINFMQNTNSFPSNVIVTAMYILPSNTYMIIGTNIGTCFYWDGSAWTQFAQFDGIINAFTQSTYNTNNYLYIGGDFDNQTYSSNFSCMNLAAYDTSTWTGYMVSERNVGTTGMSGPVYCLNEYAKYPNLLFVGGNYEKGFKILDLNSYQQPYNPYYKNIAGISGGFTGNGTGINPFIYTISSNSSGDIFIGGDFAQVINAGPNGNETYDIAYGVKWSCDSAGVSTNTFPDSFLPIGSGFSSKVNCSFFNDTTDKFCVGFSGSNSSISNYLEFDISGNQIVTTSPFTVANEIKSIYADSLTLFADIYGNVYKNGTLIGNSSTTCNQGIVYSSQFSKYCFATSNGTANTYGFYTWTDNVNNKINCTLPPASSLIWNGVNSSSTTIELTDKGSYFILYWDGTNYRSSTNQYYNVLLV